MAAKTPLGIKAKEAMDKVVFKKHIATEIITRRNGFLDSFVSFLIF